jgi:hypothetical protein
MLFTSTYCPACEAKASPVREVDRGVSGCSQCGGRMYYSSRARGDGLCGGCYYKANPRHLFVGEDGELWFGSSANDAIRVTMPGSLGPVVGFQVQYSHTLGLGVYVYRRNEHGDRRIEILANTMLPMDASPRKWPENGVVTVSVRP